MLPVFEGLLQMTETAKGHSGAIIRTISWEEKEFPVCRMVMFGYMAIHIGTATSEKVCGITLLSFHRGRRIQYFELLGSWQTIYLSEKNSPCPSGILIGD